MPSAEASGLGRCSLDLATAADAASLAVEFVNGSAATVRIWSRGCALGWDSLTLLVATAADAADGVRLCPPPRNWTRDGPVPLPVEAGGRVRLASWPGEPDWVGGESLARWRDRPLALHAELRIEASAEASLEGIASGVLRSPLVWSSPRHGWLFGDAPPS